MVDNRQHVQCVAFDAVNQGIRITMHWQAVGMAHRDRAQRGILDDQLQTAPHFLLEIVGTQATPASLVYQRTVSTNSCRAAELKATLTASGL